MDLSLLQVLERETIMEVLQRDKLIRSIEEDRIRRMKCELQEMRRKGAKSYTRQYSDRACARCQRPLGKFWNSGAVCRGCSHRICIKCRVGVSSVNWKCTVCHAYRDVKIRSGEWFLEERAKKFPATTERHETVGETLLKSYPLSHISVVPPTPPPFLDSHCLNRLQDLKNSKPFTKSMEDLMVIFTSHMKKVSKSQNDVRGDHVQLGVARMGLELGHNYNGHKSLSDTNINRTFPLTKGPSLPNLFKKSKDSDPECWSTGAEEEVSLGSEYSGGDRGTISSGSTDCGLYDGSASVTGELELSLAYNFNTSSLEITVKACRNLLCGDIKRKKCNPYVKFFLLPEKTKSSKVKTTTKKNTTEPVYNEVLQYHIESLLLTSRTLQASVWHRGAMKRKAFLGEVLISLESWRFEDKTSQLATWYPLCPKCPAGGAVEQDRGEMVVSVKLSSASQTSSVCQPPGVNTGPHDQLTVLIKGAKHLPNKANTSQSTYAKGCLLLPGGRERVQTTTKTKPDSEWSHQMVFDRLSSSELGECSLTLDLWDHSHFHHSDRHLGVVRLRPGSPWKPVLQMPNKWHDLILPVLASANPRRSLL